MNDQEKLSEISRLLDEAYKHYFEYEGHCKHSEGYIQLEFGTYWERESDPTHVPIKNVHIYSYVFCKEGRSQDFDSLDEALETVREWHAKEMAYDYNAPEEVAARKEMDDFAVEWIEQMQATGRLTIIELSHDDEA